MGVTSGAGTTYPSRAPGSPPVFSGVRVTRSLVLCVCFVDRCWFFCTLAIVLSIRFQFTAADLPFKLFLQIYIITNIYISDYRESEKVTILRYSLIIEENRG